VCCVLCIVWVVCQRYVCVLICEGVIFVVWSPTFFCCFGELGIVDILCACWVCHKCVCILGCVSHLCVCEIFFFLLATQDLLC